MAGRYDQVDDQYDAELLINARESADVSIKTMSTSDAIIVPGGSSVHYNVSYTMRVTNETEYKGQSHLL